MEIPHSFESSSVSKSSVVRVSSASRGRCAGARALPRKPRMLPPSSFMGSASRTSTTVPPLSVRTCVPCIQLSMMSSFSFMSSLISSSLLAEEMWAMAASLLTTFSNSLNSLTCSTSSSISDVSSSFLLDSITWRSSAYLNISPQRCRTTESIRSRGWSAMTLMLLLITRPKMHMMTTMNQTRPIAAAASSFLGVDRSKNTWKLL
mmetsp:Transcript_125668/g.391309  ORF Transcript_125668/g.391309 Transcript_125668/m.391309 type:complete len:205 (+) Transcript_125668:1161-1775(+)